MQKFEDVVQRTNGDVIPSATVTVYDAGTANVSTIYSDEIGTGKANPFATDSSGRLWFYAPAGDYDIKIEKIGYTTQWRYDVSLYSDEFVTDVVTIEDNLASAFVIEEGSNSYFKIVTTNGAEKVLIANNTLGTKVGVGTTSPYSKLFVGFGEFMVDYGGGGVTNGAALRLATNDAQCFFMGNGYYSDASPKYSRTGGSAYINIDISTTAAAGDIGFYTAPSGTADTVPTYTRRMVIKQNGNVGIGLDTPAAMLHVSGDIRIDQPFALLFANGQNIRDNDGGGLLFDSPVPGAELNFTTDNGDVTFVLGVADLRVEGSSAGIISNSTSSGAATYVILEDSGVSLGGFVAYQSDHASLPQQVWIKNYHASGPIVLAAGGGSTEHVFIDPSGKVGIGTNSPTSPLQVVGLPVYANNAAAIAGGLTAGALYRTGADPDPVMVVH